MAAGLGFKDFVTGEVLTAADVDGYLMQGVWVFADAAARTAAVTSPQEGNVSFLKDTNSTEYYSGSAWVAIGGSVPTSLEFTAGKNKIINGDFNVNQRNFTTVTADNSFSFDRWKTSVGSSGGTNTITPQTFTPGAAPVSGYEGKNFIQMLTASQSGASDWAGVCQNIEDVRSFAGQTITISFWAKAASGTPNIGVTVVQDFGSGGSTSVKLSPSIQTITTSWVRYSFNVTLGSLSGKTIGTSNMLQIFIFGSVGSTLAGLGFVNLGLQNNTFGIWGVQVEAGSTATAFQTATGTYQGELAVCQRYYQRLDSTDSNFTPFMFGAGTNTTNIRFFANLPVSMRVNGNVTVSAFGTFTTGNGNAAITAVGGGFMRNKNTLLVDMTTNSATVQRSAYSLEANNSATASIQIESEL
jgi:hypothetical protein